MFSRVRASWSVVFIVVTVALNALPVAARSANTTVTISVSPVQQVEGSTSLIVSAGGPLQQGRLVVKSNTAWVLVAHTSEPGAVVAWKIDRKSTRLNSSHPSISYAV